jgi:hypothetical protein
LKWLFIIIASLITTQIVYKLFFSAKNKREEYQKITSSINPIIEESTKLFNSNKTESYSNKQLAEVLKCKFEKKRLFNHTEEKVYRLIIEMINTHAKGHFKVNGQTNLGEFIKCKEDFWGNKAFKAINSKRVDLLIVNRDLMPVAAIEVNGTGHYFNNALERDEIKRAAIESAGIKYIAIRENEDSKEKLERELLYVFKSAINK